MTVRLEPANLMRAPFELACSPSPAFMTPAFAISSLNFIIAFSNSGLGITPASESLLAFTITMNLISSLSLIEFVCVVSEPGAVATGSNSCIRENENLLLWKRCDPVATALGSDTHWVVGRTSTRSTDSGFFSLPKSQCGAGRILNDAQPTHVRYFDRVLHDLCAQRCCFLCRRADVINQYVSQPE